MSYIAVSDLHCHAWSSFSKTNPDGVNSRLRIILDELERAAAYGIAKGAKSMVMSGDIHHVRGAIDPEVLNPLQTTIQKILDMGLEIHAIDGNHDLKGKEASEIGSAVKTLVTGPGASHQFKLWSQPTFIILRDGQQIAMIPYRSRNEDMLADLQNLADVATSDPGGPGDPSKIDVFIHAGIDGVLTDMPAHGLTDTKLGSFGFRHVFAGHYHNHKIMRDGVVSIGATTHQTWSDVGTKAGFLFVDDDGNVEFNASHAPEFVDVTGMTESDMMLSSDGNYVRFRAGQLASNDILELKKAFINWGAKGTSIQAVKPVVNARNNAAPASSAVTLDQSVQGYIENNADLPAHIDKTVLKQRAAAILAQARAVYAEA